MADAKADTAKNFDLKFIGNHHHVDSAGKVHDFKPGDVGHFTEAEAEAIRKAGSAVLNTPADNGSSESAKPQPSATVVQK
jgi:hypothetical protein